MTSNQARSMNVCHVSRAFLLICILGCGGTAAPELNVEWIDPNEIQQGPTQHDTLPAELLARIKIVHAIFADVDGTPLDKWIDDFKCDLNPEGIWCHSLTHWVCVPHGNL